MICIEITLKIASHIWVWHLYWKYWTLYVIYGCGISTENTEPRKVKYIINRQKIFDYLSILFVPFTKYVLLSGDDTQYCAKLYVSHSGTYTL